MSETSTATVPDHLGGVQRARLFAGSCMSLVSTSVAFGVVTSLMTDLKDVFALTNQQAGWIGGAALWGFTISIFVFGPLVDVLKMQNLLRFAWVAHLLGPILMITANGFTMLFAGALIIALANGTIEAVCNPLVATLYPNDKTTKLNQFHVWFPGGIVIGGLLSFFIDAGGIGGAAVAAWQIKLALIFVPTVLYGIIFIGQKFPVTERVQSGVSFGGMFEATFFRPLFWVIILCMSLTASLELGPNRWMGDVMTSALDKALGESGLNSGILVLVYGSGLMAILRYFAGPVVHRLSPTGLLTCSSILAGLGLMAMTFAQGLFLIVICATIFYLGVCYFWPTILGVVSERIPKGGALALALVGGWGMAVVGLITVPVMGVIADRAGHGELEYAQVEPVIENGYMLLEEMKGTAAETEIPRFGEAVEVVTEARTEMNQTNQLPPVTTATALREIARIAQDKPVAQDAHRLVKKADDAGGIASFRAVALSSIILILIFGSLFMKDRSRGGYKAEKIVGEGGDDAQTTPA